MFSAAPGSPMCSTAASSERGSRHQSEALGRRSSRARHSHRCSPRPKARLIASASAKPGNPRRGISVSDSSSCATCMATSTISVSRLRRCARITLAMEAFQASSIRAGASAIRKGCDSGSTSAGAFISRSSGPAKSSAISAVMPPSQLLAPSAARAVASATARRPPPSACVITTLMPAPMMRNRMKSVAAS